MLWATMLNGQRVAPYAAADHYDHVHVAYTGPFGDGIGDAARSARKFFSGQDLITAIAVAGPESGYRDSARLVTSAEDSRGMWQVNTKAHPWARGLNLADTDTAARAAKRVHDQAGGWGPWSGFTGGGYRAFLSRARSAVAALGGGASAGGGGGSAGNMGAGTGVAIGNMGFGVGKLGGGGKQTTGLGGKLKPISMGLPGLDSGAGVTDQPSGTDYIDALIAEAGLTAGTDDDKAALAQLVSFFEGDLASARASGDPRRVTAAASGLKGAREAMEALTGALESKQRQEEQDRVLRQEQVANQNKILALAQQGPGILLAGVIAAVNGDIGGRTGLGFQTVGYPGAVAAY